MSQQNSNARKFPRMDVQPIKRGVSSVGGKHAVMVRIVPPSLEATSERPPLNLSLVLDRSGSMSGEPLENAKRAASQVVGMLGPNDRLSVVVYDNTVDVIVPSTPVHDPQEIRRLIGQIHARGSTDLHAGWLEGASQVAKHMNGGSLDRVILLSDGCANHGVTDLTEICSDVARLRTLGVSTSALGLGRHFNEDLLLGMADAGAGNFYFIETADDLEVIFEAELTGTSATVGRNVELEFSDMGSGTQLVDTLNDFEAIDGGLQLPNLIAGLDVEIGIVFRTPELPVGESNLGKLQLRWRDAAGETIELAESIQVNVVAPNAYEAIPEDIEVASLVAELKEARTKERARHALDAGDGIAARRLLAASRDRLSAMPQTDRIKRELIDMDQIDAAMSSNDIALSRKRMREQVNRKQKSFYHERIGRQAPDAIETVEVTRRDGSTGRIELVTGDITDEAVDAILNPTNSRLYGTGRSVDGSVHRKGGMELTRACREIGFVEVGDTVVTEGFGLPAKYVLHTAVPEWGGEEGKARKQLWSCYRTALDLAERMNLRTLSVPAVGAGTNRVPPEVAAETAISNIVGHLGRTSTMLNVRIVLFDRALVPVYRDVLRNVGSGVA